MLLDRGAQHLCTPRFYDTPLTLAAENGHTDVCEMIIDRGIDEEVDSLISVMTCAISKHHVDIARLVLTKVEPHVLHDFGTTPLHHAVRVRDWEICNLLLDFGAPQLRDLDGTTPLHIAVEHGDYRICELLLDRGAEQVPDRNGVTPLYYAIVRNHMAVCKLLINRGARLDTRASGWSPLAFADHLGLTDMHLLLVAGGAQAESSSPSPRDRLRIRVLSDEYTGDSAVCA